MCCFVCYCLCVSCLHTMSCSCQKRKRRRMTTRTTTWMKRRRSCCYLQVQSDRLLNRQGQGRLAWTGATFLFISSAVIQSHNNEKEKSSQCSTRRLSHYWQRFRHAGRTPPPLSEPDCSALISPNRRISEADR